MADELLPSGPNMLPLLFESRTNKVHALADSRRTGIVGENMSVLRNIPSDFIDLIYADPPFFTNRHYGRNGSSGTIFSDMWKGGLSAYLSWIRPRLLEMRRVLRPGGSIYVHIDWHAAHYVRMIMDEVFGYRNFLNEIIWHYHDPGGTVRDRFKKKHDTILLYARNAEKHRFYTDAVREEYSAGTLNQAKRGEVSFGRPTKINQLGKVPEDVWEIPIINSQAKERNGYPTQKPEALLERIINASSLPGDLVADFFSGSGTTAAVAERLGRRWIVSDISQTGMKLLNRRIKMQITSADSEYRAMTCGLFTCDFTADDADKIFAEGIAHCLGMDRKDCSADSRLIVLPHECAISGTVTGASELIQRIEQEVPEQYAGRIIVVCGGVGKDALAMIHSETGLKSAEFIRVSVLPDASGSSAEAAGVPSLCRLNTPPEIEVQYHRPDCGCRTALVTVTGTDNFSPCAAGAIISGSVRTLCADDLSLLRGCEKYQLALAEGSADISVYATDANGNTSWRREGITF